MADSFGLSLGSWSGSVTPQRSGDWWLAARDTVAGIEGPRTRVAVPPAPPSRLVLSPDSLALTAGVPAGVTAFLLDAYGNRAPAPAAQALVLWSDRPAGVFSDEAGSRIPLAKLATRRGSGASRRGTHRPAVRRRGPRRVPAAP